MPAGVTYSAHVTPPLTTGRAPAPGDNAMLAGLSEKEAEHRLRTEGYNELPAAKRRGIASIALDVLREPMFLLLIAAAAIYFALGDKGEALVLLGSVSVVVLITIVQQRKTERVLEALRHMASPRALVIRDGKQRRIPGREVVRGDIVVVAEGDRVAADATLLACTALTTDESLLTGESLPVTKSVWDGVVPMTRPGGEGLPFVYSGTMVAQGHGIARVEATGVRSEMGRIGKALSTLQPEDTPLQRETRRLVRNLALIGLALCLAVAVAYVIDRGEWLGALLAGLTLAMAIVPEEFPVVLTVFLALGAWRISRKNVLTRRVPAIETLGAATVLCVDKTGTLTQNRMAVRQVYAVGEHCTIEPGGSLPVHFHEIVATSVLACEAAPFDAMERAFLELGQRLDSDPRADLVLLREYPLSPRLLAVSRVWQLPGQKDYLVAAKGAPEAIAELCHITGQAGGRFAHQVAAMAAQGLRVIAVAKARLPAGQLPEAQSGFAFELLGLVGLADPIRPSVPAALQECYSAGIRVVMITGDYPVTAQAIAGQIGLSRREEVITGDELERLTAAELRSRIRSTNVFARIMPEQKLRLVEAFKAAGEIVAMTGDGVNDAPALRAAHIGIAMGGRGTDVAREAGSLVLLDDDFASIVDAVRLGRRIFENLRKAMSYILAVHVPTVGMSFVPLLFGWPLVLFPVHIVFLEFVIDPACSVAFEAEPEEDDIMTRPPRNPAEPLFPWQTVAIAVLQGVMAWLAVWAVFGYALQLGRPEDEIRALTFTAIVAANLCLIFANRSTRHTILGGLHMHNPALWWVVGGTVAMLVFALVVPAAQRLFRFAPISLDTLALALAAAFASILWYEGFKRYRARGRHGGARK